MSPLLLLSLLNRFLFGKVVCVLDENGLHYEGGFIEWSAVTGIDYEARLPLRSGPAYSYARIIGSGIEIKLLHAPHLLLKKARKHNPDIQTGLSRDSKEFLALLWIALTVVIVVLSVMMALH